MVTGLDLEGVSVSGDFAAEGLEMFMRGKIDNHENLYEVLSTVDDVWADNQAPSWKKDYVSGMTLNLVHVPLKAWGATNEFFETVGKEVTKLYPFAVQAIGAIRNIEPNLFINTTSWDRCVKPIMDEFGISMDNVYCSVGELDKFEVDEKDVKIVKNEIQKIAYLPVPKLNKYSEPVDDKSWETVNIVNEFYEWICDSSFSPFLDLKIVEKSESIRDMWKRTGLSGKETVGAGDSITDKKALELIRDKGGSAISYTGNKYAVYAGNIGVISYSPAILAVLVEYHKKGGLEKLKKLAEKVRNKAQLDFFRKVGKKVSNKEKLDDAFKLYQETLKPLYQTLFKNGVSESIFKLYREVFQDNVPIIVDLTEMSEIELVGFVNWSTGKRSEYRKSELLGRLG
jgi:predicted HAD superfamily phosphohydrolase